MTQIITSTKKILANLAIASFVLTVVAPVVAIAAGPATITFVAPAANASFKVNQVVNFQTTVTGGTAPYQYSWNFGDGNTSSDNDGNIGHSFSTTGSKTVTLRVTDADGVQTEQTRTVNITANTALTALITGPSEGATVNQNQVINFTTQVTGGVAPYQYSWNFGDGVTSSDNDGNIGHSFSTTGSKTVTLRVTDDAGTQVDTVIHFTVAPVVNNGLNVTITAPTNGGQVNANQLVNFTVAVTGGNAPYQYSWNFDDGTAIISDNDGTIGHSFSVEKAYNVTVRVTDEDGTQKTASVTVNVGPVTNPDLVISNIRIVDITKTSARITWTTNLRGTSRVIYGKVSHQTINPDDAPNFGYENSTVKQDIDNKVYEHSVTLSNLTPNTHYYFRVLSAK